MAKPKGETQWQQSVKKSGKSKSAKRPKSQDALNASDFQIVSASLTGWNNLQFPSLNRWGFFGTDSKASDVKEVRRKLLEASPARDTDCLWEYEPQGLLGVRSLKVADDCNFQSYSVKETWPQSGRLEARCRRMLSGYVTIRYRIEVNGHVVFSEKPPEEEETKHSAPDEDCECGIWGMWDTCKVFSEWFGTDTFNPSLCLAILIEAGGGVVFYTGYQGVA